MARVQINRSDVASFIPATLNAGELFYNSADNKLKAIAFLGFSDSWPLKTACEGYPDTWYYCLGSKKFEKASLQRGQGLSDHWEAPWLTLTCRTPTSS